MAREGSKGADLVEVARANDFVHGETLRGLLEDSGIPCMVRSIGIDGPTIGIGLAPRSPQQVLVRREDAAAAREALEDRLREGQYADLEATIDFEKEPGRGPRNYTVIGAFGRAYVLSALAMGLAFAVFLLLRGL